MRARFESSIPSLIGAEVIDNGGQPAARSVLRRGTGRSNSWRESRAPACNAGFLEDLLESSTTRVQDPDPRAADGQAVGPSPVRELEFMGTVRSNEGRFSREMVIPGRGGLVLSPADWPEVLVPGTLNIAVGVDGFRKDLEQIAEGDGLNMLNLCDGMLVQVAVRESERQGKLKTPGELICDWCEAASNIEDDFGTEKAMGYLIGEKFLNFLEVAETNGEWREAIPEFVGGIKSLFDTWQIATFVKTPRHLGALGHVASDESHRMFREAMEESERISEDARNLMLLAWAEELLLQG